MKRLLRHFPWFFSPSKPVIKKIIPPTAPTYDLQQIYNRINTLYFHGRLDLTIAWSKKRSTKGRRSRRLGSYCLQRKRILIDGRLDHPDFPEEFIAFLVYHEMLHSVLPPLFLRSGRRTIHHKAFREKEREFHRYAEVKQWEKDHSHLFFG